jgi:outer membrane protein insertion porin family
VFIDVSDLHWQVARCVEVPNNFNSMRFSPVLLAALTASAAFGLAKPVKAQTASDQRSGTANSSEAVQRFNQGISVNGIDGQPSVDSLSKEVVSFTNPQELPSEELMSQIPVEPTPGSPPEGAPGAPPAGSQTPEQSSPPQNGIEVSPSPDSNQQGSPVELAPTPAEGQPPEAPVEPSPAAPDGQQQPETPTPAPGTLPAPAPTSEPGTTEPQTSQPEARVLVGEVVVSGAEGDLQDEVYRVIQTQPGRTTTRSQLQEDINAIFATGDFSSVQAVPEDTPLGVRVTFVVQPNPVLRSVQLQGSQVETLQYDGKNVPIQQALDDIFGEQYGKTANLRDLQQGIQRLNQLYQSNGYVLAQVVGAPRISPDGVATLDVAEGVIENIQIRFLNKDGQAVNDKGEPVRGRTRPFIITREFESKPGDVFNQARIQNDLRRAFALGIFDDLNISLNPGEDPRRVDVIVNVTERNTGSLAAGAGVSSASGLFGTASFQEQNLGGNNQRLNTEVQIGQRDLLFDLSFTDPWIATDPYRTSYTVNAFGRQSVSLVFDGGPNEVYLPNGDRPRVRRYGGGVSFSRPVDEWLFSLGVQFQNVSVRDLDGVITPRDEFGDLLSFHDSGIDNLLTVQFAASQDNRNDPTQTTSGSAMRFSMEQTIPVDGITFNRVRASYSYFIPVRIARFTAGCRKNNPSPGECAQTIAFNVQGGTILGDLPPYEAFALGGTDSVPGYGAGELGSGRSYAQISVEYRFPIFSVVGGTLLADFGSDLGTAAEVPGDPAGIRDKPGTGFDVGAGLRVQTPLGQIRINYAVNDQGDGRFSFGIGERF